VAEPTPPGGGGEQLVQPRAVEELEILRLLELRPELGVIDRRRLVEERPRRRGDRDPQARLEIATVEIAGPVDDDSRGPDPPAVGERDVDAGTAPTRDDPDQLCGRAMAQHRVRPAGEDGGEPATLLAQKQRWHDREDAAIEAMDPPRCSPIARGRCWDSGADQLIDGDDAVPAGGDRVDPEGCWGVWCRHLAPKHPGIAGCAPAGTDRRDHRTPADAAEGAAPRPTPPGPLRAGRCCGCRALQSLGRVASPSRPDSPQRVDRPRPVSQDSR